MRNPARKVFYCLAAIVVGAALIRFGASRLERIEEDLIAVSAIALGFAIIPFPLVTLVQALFAVRGRARLLAGIGVIARWRVSPADWDRFRGLDDRRSSEDFSLGNDLWVGRSTPRADVEVIVGEKGALVDESFHSLSPRGLAELRGVGWLSGPVDCLEFALLYRPSRYSGRVRTNLRIPVPADAHEGARRVLAHFERRLRPAPVDPRKIERVYSLGAGLFVAAMAAVAAGWAYGAFENPDVPLGLLIGGGILALFASLFILATILLTPRGNR